MHIARTDSLSVWANQTVRQLRSLHLQSERQGQRADLLVVHSVAEMYTRMRHRQAQRQTGRCTGYHTGESSQGGGEAGGGLVSGAFGHVCQGKWQVCRSG